MLSKDDTQHPPVGDVRVISILPSLTKLYEVILHREIMHQVQTKHPLHPRQRGFVLGGSCLKNISELVDFVRLAHDKVQAQIRGKVAFKRRPKTYLVFIDLKKAFDTVNRAKLIQVMIGREYDYTVIKAFREFSNQMTLST